MWKETEFRLSSHSRMSRRRKYKKECRHKGKVKVTLVDDEK